MATLARLSEVTQLGVSIMGSRTVWLREKESMIPRRTEVSLTIPTVESPNESRILFGLANRNSFFTIQLKGPPTHTVGEAFLSPLT